MKTPKSFRHFLAALIFASAVIFCSACSSPDVQNTRAAGLENRQSRMDSRTGARQERWKVRGEREDARAAGRLDSW
jgi:hypothetical protein